MPAYTMPGLMTGQNTNDIIKKLVELEKKPAKRWETDNEYAKLQTQVWNELKNQSLLLQTRTRALVSFTAPFATKTVSSSVEGFITGEASRSAKAGDRNLEVLELASKHQISGNAVDSTVSLPAGVFTIHVGKNQETINFAGGSLNDLITSIKNSAGTLVSSGLVKIDRDSSILTMTSNKTGKANQLFFSDPNGILKEAGLVSESAPSEESQSSTIDLDIETSSPHSDKKFKESTVLEKKPILGETGIIIQPDTAFVFPISEKEISSRTKITFEMEGEVPPIWEVGVRYEKDNSGRTRMLNLNLDSGKYILPISDYAEGKKLTKIILTNGGLTPITIKSIQILSEARPGDASPVIVLQEAKDAKLKIDGVEIFRESNEGITDVLDGISFNVHKTTTEPVTLKIQTDNAKGIVLIKEWVEAYNSLMKFSKEVTSVDKDAKMSDKKAVDSLKDQDISREFWESKSKSGLLSGDNSVLRLIAGMKTAANSYYPSKGYRVLSDIGISTGAIGSNWTKIQEGVLVIDDEGLKSAVSENPDGVRELFATDANGDGKMEDGLGTRLLEHLKPYTQFPVGIISSKIKLLEENIAQNNKRIKDNESHLSSYESKLKQRFLYMEQGVGKNKSVGNYLQNNLFRSNGQE